MLSDIKRFISQYIEKKKALTNAPYTETYDYCPKCDAILLYQKGYNPKMTRWICKGCGELLINPCYEGSDTTWICDGCGSVLNDQSEFSEASSEWTCTECGYTNPINANEVFLSADEFKAYYNSPLRGLSDSDALRLTKYVEIEQFKERENVTVVEDSVNGQKYLKKELSVFDESVYRYLYDNPIERVPRIIDLFKSARFLIVIEEYIEGRTLSEILEDGNMSMAQAVDVIKQLCIILEALNGCPKPIVHRDIKPSNVILKDTGEVFLIDINAAKWVNEDSVEDTQLLGTQYYAAPEQYGFGTSGSSEKTDVYALGVLLNKMITGKFPKECKAPQPIGDIVDWCMGFDKDKRCSAGELYSALEKLKG